MKTGRITIRPAKALNLMTDQVISAATLLSTLLIL
jgi:hypothetical protein